MVFVIKGLPPYIRIKRQSWKKNYELRLPPNPERPEDLPPPWDACPPILAILVRSALLIAAKPLLELPEPEPELRPELLLLLLFPDLELEPLLPELDSELEDLTPDLEPEPELDRLPELPFEFLPFDPPLPEVPLPDDDLPRPPEPEFDLPREFPPELLPRDPPLPEVNLPWLSLC